MGAPSSLPNAAEMDAVLKASRQRQKVTGLLVALLVHAVIVGGLAYFAFPLAPTPPPTLIISAENHTPAEVVPKRTVTHSVNPERPAAPSSAAAKVITAVAVSPTAVPQIDAPVDVAMLGVDLGEGAGFGAGLGMGAGVGLGGTTFFGNKAEGQHIAFVVDVSASMSNDQFSLMKRELTRSLTGLAPGTRYQVIFFSGPVWFAGQRITYESRNRAIVEGHRGKKLVWESEDGRAGGFVFADGKQALPVQPWRNANPSDLRQVKEDVQSVRKSFGTSWHQPLFMALSMDPKPDVIYFMTDGAVSKAAEAVDEISKRNRRGGRKAKIFTTAMMEPKAAEQLYELAKKNSGTFSKVDKDGSVVTGRKALK